MTQIFISYAKADKSSAEQIYYSLQKVGLRSWMRDKDLLPGAFSRYTTRKAIRSSSYFLALLSKKFLSESGKHYRELKFAVEENEEKPTNTIFIIPVRLQECTVDGYLDHIQYADFFPSFEAGMEKLLQVLEPENQKEKNGNTYFPFSPLASESGQKLLGQLKPPPFRKWIIWIICLLSLLVISLCYIFRPNPMDEYLKSATRFLNSAMYSDALDQYEQALKLCPECPEVLTGRKKAELFKEIAETDYNPSEMLIRLNNVPGIPQDDPHIRLLTGNVYAQLGEDKKAEAIYLELTRKFPEFAEAWFSLGVLYHKRGNREQARNMYEKAVSICENNFRYLDNLAWIDLEAGKYDSAIQSYEKMLTDKNFLLAYAEIAKALWLNRQPKMALVYQRSLAEKIENEQITDRSLNKGPWFFPVGNESVVLDNINTKKYYAAYSLAATCYLLGRTSEAETYVKKAKALETRIGYADAINIRTLTDHDIWKIQERYAEDNMLRNRAEEFRSRFLKKED